MGIPYGTRYTIQIEGGVWKPVKCEFCGCEYVYLVKHRARGEATNVLWLDKQGAISDAKSYAQQNLNRYLKDAIGEYSCPDCGKYQPDVLERMKAANRSSATVLVVLTLVFSIPLAYDVTGNYIIAILLSVLPSLVVANFWLGKWKKEHPNSNAKARENRSYSESYPVLKKSEVERLLKPEEKS